MSKTTGAALLAGALLALGAAPSAAQPAPVLADGYPSYCDRLYHGTPASTPSYFHVAPGVAVARYLTYHPVYGWCGYPLDPHTAGIPTGFSYPHSALRYGAMGVARTVLRRRG